MSIIIKKQTINRLLKDIKQIIKNPLTDQGIYYVHDDTDLLKGYAMIVGPSDTPYFGGFYFFEFSYPTDYPHSPPRVKYCTNGNNIRFNPNLYRNGKVCISLLNTWEGDQWTSCQTITTILLTLCSILCKDPLLNEPGITIEHSDMKNYTEIVCFSNINIAICDILSKKPSIYMPFFDNFYIFAKESFLNNYDTIVSFAKNKSEDNDIQNANIKTDFCDMNVHIDYIHLLTKLSDTKTLLV